MNKQGHLESSVVVLVSVHMLQVCGHIKHVVVLVVLLCVINSAVIGVPTYALFTCMRIPCNCSRCEKGSFEVLSLQAQKYVLTFRFGFHRAF